eukprot:TRINITY_DN6425_c0_g1_i4.p1 TRINITY_DN6425_c0_g1~~TRINITY_DN6425_c0_g1_i4.p1  ORF type:complete len:611 (-),score=105.78 TRINITY_DN6425_c0_g1_i4:10-1812(-)
MFRCVVVCLCLLIQVRTQFPDFAKWDTVLRSHVHASTLQGVAVNVVDYVAISSDSTFHEFLGDLEGTAADTLDSMNRQEWYSFWINAYNAFTIKLVTDTPCNSDAFGSCGKLTSLRRAHFSPDRVWTDAVPSIAGQSLSLATIFDNKLRNPPKRIGTVDPRLHAAVVKAAISSPDLRREAYWPNASLDVQLSEAMRDFLGRDLSFQSGDSPLLKLSAIFDTYHADFGANVVDFIAQRGEPNVTIPFLAEPLRQNVLATDPKKLKITYFTFNWDLNGSPVTGSCGSRSCVSVVGFVVLIVACTIGLISALLFIVFLHKYRRESVPYESLEASPLNDKAPATEENGISDAVAARYPVAPPLRRALLTVLKVDIVLLLVGGIAIALVFHSQTLGALRGVLDWATEHRATGAIALIIAYAIATVLFVPGSILTLGAGFVFEWWGLLFVWSGASVGMVLAFLCGRYLFRSWVATRTARNWRFVAIDKMVKEEGWKIVLLLRLAPIVPFNLLNYALALTDIKLLDYTVASCVGIIPGTAMFIYFGTVAHSLTDVVDNNTSGSSATTRIVVLAVSGVLIICFVVFVGIKAKKALARAMENTPEERKT